jgi:hypothetical protein
MDEQRSRLPEDGPVGDDPTPALRFSLRTLMLATAGIAVSMTVWRALGPAVGTGLAVTLAAVLAHVAGNALGSRLRDKTRRDLESRPISREAFSSVASAADDGPPFAPVTRLSERAPLGWFLPAITSVGALAGAALAAWWMWTYQRAASTPGTLTVGCLAMGLFSGLGTFWVFGLLQVFLGAWWQAHRYTADKESR